jgi:hypothetical protein
MAEAVVQKHGGDAEVGIGRHDVRCAVVAEVEFAARQGFPEEIAIAGEYGWVAYWEGGLRVIDLNDPDSPVEVGFYDPAEMLTFVSVGDQHAGAANQEAGLLVFDKCELPVFAAK